MKLVRLNKIHEGKFLTYYVADYETKLGHIKSYEFISRDKNLKAETFGKGKPAGVGMVPISLDKSKVLLQAEYRLATNNIVYNFPAGLIDEGEDALKAATRELKEETGVNLVKCIDILSPSFASQGTSDELMQIVVCLCEGEIKDSTFEEEEIHAKWYDKKEIKELLDKGVYMSVRTQMFLWQWVNEDKLK